MSGLANTEQKEIFLVVSQLDEHFCSDDLFFACPIVHARLRARKVGRLERNLSTPVKAFFPGMYSEQSNI